MKTNTGQEPVSVMDGWLLATKIDSLESVVREIAAALLAVKECIASGSLSEADEVNALNLLHDTLLNTAEELKELSETAYAEAVLPGVCGDSRD